MFDSKKLLIMIHQSEVTDSVYICKSIQ